MKVVRGSDGWLYVYLVIQHGFIAGHSAESPAMRGLFEQSDFDVYRLYRQVALEGRKNFLDPTIIVLNCL